jgi:cysteine desulfurase
MSLFKNNKIYLDYAGATPIDPNIHKKISLYERKFFANPSSIHKIGLETNKLIEKSRSLIAKLIFAHSDEIIFTGSGTESNSLAVLGVVNQYYKDNSKIPHIITSKIEHPSILENFKYLEESGKAKVSYIGVDKDGFLDLEELKDSMILDTILVSIMYANNEIGTIQPIKEISKEIRHFKKVNNVDNVYPIFHTDACQAMNYLDVSNIEKLGVDLMSFNSSKIYGPKSIGVLYKKRNINITPIYSGGGQEFGLRSGTSDVRLISGVALALEKTFKIKEKESLRLLKLRDYCIDKLLNIKVGDFKIILNGSKNNRLPNNINISVGGISSELLVLELDALNIQVSEKSACHSKSQNSSYVIKAIRKICRKGEDDQGSLRISLGRYTKKRDLDILVKSLNKILNKYINFYK